MNLLINKVAIQVNPTIYLKDPASSELGRKIVSESINLIYKLGYEEFTFKKLSVKIKSTEASIYRYFESKHKLLLYLSSWYWAWTEYKLVFAISNIKSPITKLEKAIQLITEDNHDEEEFGFVNKSKLSQIIVNESSKIYLNKNVDEENKKGHFAAYKQLVARLSEIVSEISPKYKYPNMLMSTVIEGAHLQHFYCKHLPGLTNASTDKNHITKFYTDLVLKAIKTTKK